MKQIIRPDYVKKRQKAKIIINYLNLNVNQSNNYLKQLYKNSLFESKKKI